MSTVPASVISLIVEVVAGILQSKDPREAAIAAKKALAVAAVRAPKKLPKKP